jgi:hypothetical protein
MNYLENIRENNFSLRLDPNTVQQRKLFTVVMERRDRKQRVMYRSVAQNSLCVLLFQNTFSIDKHTVQVLRSTKPTNSKNSIRMPTNITPGYHHYCGPCSSVSIATGYGLDGTRIESLCWLDFSHLSRPALGPTQPPVQWEPSLSRG